METFSGSSESPTVTAFKQQLRDLVSERNNLRGRVRDLEALVTNLVANPSTVMLVDKKCVGPMSEQINKVMGW